MNAKELSQNFNPSANTISLFQSAIKAETMVKIMQETYEPVYEKIFAKYEFFDSFDNNAPITKRDRIYSDKDEAKCQKYYNECNEVLLSMGYENAKKGFCPILEAESLMREINRAFGESIFNELVELGVMKGIEYDDLLYSLNNYKKFLEISKGIMVTKGITVTA